MSTTILIPRLLFLAIIAISFWSARTKDQIINYQKQTIDFDNMTIAAQKSTIAALEKQRDIYKQLYEQRKTEISPSGLGFPESEQGNK